MKAPIVLGFVMMGCVHASTASRWTVVAATPAVRVEVEHTEYVHPGAANANGNCYVHVRVRNLSSNVVGVDLRSRWSTIYPGCWGTLAHPGDPVVVDCLLSIVEPLGARAPQLEADFRAHRLDELAPGAALDYYRDFNGTPGGECDGRRDGTILSLGMAGSLSVVAGTAQQVRPRHDVMIPLADRWPVIPLPARIIDP